MTADAPTPSASTTTRTHLLLLLIVFAALLLRTLGLGDRPAGVFRDEAEKGYNAWALATTGGILEFLPGEGRPPLRFRRLPFTVDVMGVQTSAIYHYAAAPIVGLAGLSPATIRLPAALAGGAAVLLLGLLLIRAWGPAPGLLAALWLALQPWHLNFSRWALEGIFVPLLAGAVLGGCYGFERGRRWGLPLAGAGLGLMFYSYSGAQPLVAAWGLWLLASYGRRLRPADRSLWLGVALFLVPVIPSLVTLLAPGGAARLGRIAIWNAPGATVVSVARDFVVNYFAHFDPRFLFATGDANPRHNAAGLGQLCPLDALLIPLGLVWVWRRRPPLALALLGLLLCAPITAALTRIGIPHALRAIAFTLPAAALAGAGLSALIELGCKLRPGRGGSLRAAAFLVAVTLVALSGVYQYWMRARQRPAVRVAFEQGERLAWRRLLSESQPEDRVFISGAIPYGLWFQLFHTQPDPRRVAAYGLDPRFVYFDPATAPAVLAERLRPGDWVLEPLPPWEVPLDPDDPTTPLLPREEAERIGEWWVALRRAPAR